MPYEIDWYLQRQVLMVKVVGDITPTELLAADQMIIHFFEESPCERVYVIFDDSHAGKMPPAHVFNQIKWTQHPKTGQTVSFGSANPLHRFFASFVSQRFQVQFSQNHATLQDALAYLRRVDPKLVGQLPPEKG